jgi:DNA topoisomerase-1
VLQNISVFVGVNGNRFGFSLERTLTEGWIKLYKPYVKPKNDAVPLLIEGEKVNVKRITLSSKYTQPPPRYNPRSLLLKMEQEEIGTKATRAATIQTLHDRKYITGTDSLTVSDLGFEVAEVLSEYCPTVVSPEMTKRLEQEMDEIQQGKQTKQFVLQQATETLKIVTSELKAKEAAIGAQLSQAHQKARLEERTVGSCPQCGDGQLVILHSKKSGKRFVGCTNYFKDQCNTAYPLPQTGTIKPLIIKCRSCAAPTVAVYIKGRKPWKLCLNPACPSKGAKGK